MGHWSGQIKEKCRKIRMLLDENTSTARLMRREMSDIAVEVRVELKERSYVQMAGLLITG